MARQARVAARVEIARIYRERRDLVATMNGLEPDFATNLATSERLRRQMAAAERILGALRPEESGSRDEYELRVEARDTLLDETLATRPDSDMDRPIALYAEREVETRDAEGDYGLEYSEVLPFFRGLRRGGRRAQACRRSSSIPRVRKSAENLTQPIYARANLQSMLVLIDEP